jgi:hypothetical protein
MARQMFRHAVGQIENEELDPYVTQLGNQFEEAEADFIEYAVDLVKSDPFRFRGPGESEGEG